MSSLVCIQVCVHACACATRVCMRVCMCVHGGCESVAVFVRVVVLSCIAVSSNVCWNRTPSFYFSYSYEREGNTSLLHVLYREYKAGSILTLILFDEHSKKFQNTSLVPCAKARGSYQGQDPSTTEGPLGSLHTVCLNGTVQKHGVP